MVYTPKRIRDGLARRRPIDLAGGPDNTVVISSMARGGSTWLQELLNWRNEYRVLFEPLHVQHVPEFSSYTMRIYRHPRRDDPGLEKSLREVFGGRIHNRWINQFNTRLIARRRLIKFVRLNLFLGWTQRRFPGLKIFFLLRHPCAVSISREKCGWGSSVHQFLENEDVMADLLEPYRDVLESARDDFERGIALWCVELFAALRHGQLDKTCICYYETLATRGEEELERLFRFSGQSGADMAAEYLNRPSRLSHQESAVKTGGSIISSWRKKVTPGQIDRALEILEAFGFGGLYGAEPEPDPAVLEKLISWKNA